MSLDGHLLAAAMRDPAGVEQLTPDRWTALLTIARAEQMLGSLAHRLLGLPMPDAVARILEDAIASTEQGRVAALWEAEMAVRAIGADGGPVVLLKGTAYVAAGLKAGVGRSIGDLDILVAQARLPAVEAALLAAGWEWVKPDPYDDAYYRRWMHELPPLAHRERDRMADVHHTVLPLTARPRPNAPAMIADAMPLQGGLAVLSGADMLCHAAAHLIADGDLSGGMRNLWDIHCLIEEHGTDGLAERAGRHGLGAAVARALRLSARLYGTAIGDGWGGSATDALFLRRLTARDGWGRATRPAARLGFYIRSHALRMPPAMLARHLWTKWRKRR